MDLENKFILDPCCSVKAMWFNKNHPNVIYGDIRKEESGFLGYGRKEAIEPDMIMDFRDLPFEDKSFKLVVFDPPHLVSPSKTSYFGKKFGVLNAETWQSDLKRGFSECWRVLEDFGVLIFKWSDNEIPYKKVLKYAGKEPLFGQVSSSKATSKTYWFCFMKLGGSDD